MDNLMEKIVNLESARAKLKIHDCDRKLDCLKKLIKDAEALDEAEGKALENKLLTAQLYELAQLNEQYAKTLELVADNPKDCDTNTTEAILNGVKNRESMVKEAMRLYTKLVKKN